MGALEIELIDELFSGLPPSRIAEFCRFDIALLQCSRVNLYQLQLEKNWDFGRSPINAFNEFLRN